MPRPQPIKISKARATEIIRAASENTSFVYFTAHAKEQMKKRGITTRQVITVLRSGELMQDPFLDLNHGTWKCDVHGFSAGVNMQVVIAIEPNETNIQVITVYKVGK